VTDLHPTRAKILVEFYADGDPASEAQTIADALRMAGFAASSFKVRAVLREYVPRETPDEDAALAERITRSLRAGKERIESEGGGEMMFGQPQDTTKKGHR
jgi:hypothetical protein